MSAQVFVSYASKDQKVARTICSALESRQLRCWIASRDVGPGENFMEAIVRAIRAAKVMVLVFSSNANNSEEIKREVVLAGQNKLVVIPVRVEDVTPSDSFVYQFATRQWIDLFEDWEQQIENLSSWIVSILAVELNPTAPEMALEGTQQTAPMEQAKERAPPISSATTASTSSQPSERGAATHDFDRAKSEARDRHSTAWDFISDLVGTKHVLAAVSILLIVAGIGQFVFWLTLLVYVGHQVRSSTVVFAVVFLVLALANVAAGITAAFKISTSWLIGVLTCALSFIGYLGLLDPAFLLQGVLAELWDVHRLSELVIGEELVILSLVVSGVGLLVMLPRVFVQRLEAAS